MRSAFGTLCASALALVTAGCAEIVGVEDFTVAQGAASGGSSGAMMDDPCIKVHGCDGETAKDETSISTDTVNIAFDKDGYRPRCVRILPGTKVNFNSLSTFVDFPIAGGIYPDVDPSSPIKNPADPSVHEVEFTLSGDCVFPYFSPPNGGTMNGAIFVGSK